MKQIDIIKTYSQKRCLVVDDVPDLRASLKRILVDFGSVNVDTAGNSEEAIDLCQRHNYDIVVSDYNLGSGKNGQQLLEELRFHGLLKNTALYVMITAESASQYVLHALEYQPDDYLSKPISRDTLRPRLDQALLKNEALLNAKASLDQKNPKAAILACQKLLNKKSRYSNDARRMLAELLIGQKLFTEALKIYEQLPAERLPIWAKLGIARCYFADKRFEEAEQLLNTLLADNPNCLEAHDLLAQMFEAQNNPARAQQCLNNALTISPLSSDRQREMGRISSEVGDELSATHAYRSALKQTRNSCRELPEDYLYLAQSLTNMVRKDHNQNAKGPTSEIVEALRTVEKRFGTQPIVNIRGKLVEADLYRVQKNEDKSRELTQAALDAQQVMRISAIKNTPTRLCIDCARAFMELGEYDAGDKLLQEVAKANDDPHIAVQLDKLLREPVTTEGIQHASKLNRSGIQYYRDKAYEQAIQAFLDVLKELPNHVGLNLNLIQAIVSKGKISTITDDESEIVANSLQRIGNVDESSTYAERYQYLVRQYKRLIETSNA